MPESPVYAVSDLLAEMRQLMERSYPEIWIEGELSSLSKPASGHWYFSLKDDQAQLRCAMFRNRAGISRYNPKVGDLVRVRAKISVYTARGDLQCIVQHIEDAGLGVLQRRFDELKAKLSAEGLFSTEHKREIPAHPNRIGLITSPSGAAITDVLTTLKRRSPNTPVMVYPSVVQGDGASASLVQALQDAQQHGVCDVLLLTRGGGSMEDLWCFNDEALARAIFACSIPVISAVGHEVDVTIADFVADLRAPTPTAAAELVSPERSRMLRETSQILLRLRRAFERSLQSRAQRVDMTYGRLRHPRESIARQTKALQGLGSRLLNRLQHQHRVTAVKLKRDGEQLLRHHPQRTIQQHRRSLSNTAQRFAETARRDLNQRRRDHAHLGEQLHIVSPLATLDRGFSIAFNPQGEILRDVHDINLDDPVSLKLARGRLQCQVKEIVPADD